jgi:hypothetical protein
MDRYKAIIGPCLRVRSFSGQQTETAVGVAVLNQMLDAYRPDFIRRLNHYRLKPVGCIATGSRLKGSRLKPAYGLVGSVI